MQREWGTCFRIRAPADLGENLRRWPFSETIPPKLARLGWAMPHLRSRAVAATPTVEVRGLERSQRLDEFYVVVVASWLAIGAALLVCHGFSHAEGVDCAVQRSTRHFLWKLGSATYLASNQASKAETFQMRELPTLKDAAMRAASVLSWA
jgi:hypothetical protein